MFNIRVYGIMIIDNKILLSDEFTHSKNMTKFCGGGLELGEGTIECLKREFIEEMNLEIEVVSHFYTTDFYQKDAFRENSQLISIYYLVKPAGYFNVSEVNKLSNKNDLDETISFRFVDLKDLKEDVLTWPIDKYVVRLLISN